MSELKGRYMGMMHALAEDEKEAIREIRAREGVEAAIVVMQAMKRERGDKPRSVEQIKTARRGRLITPTEEQRAELRRLCESGTSAYAISRRIGFHESVVLRLLHEMGLAIQPTKRVLAARKAAQVRKAAQKPVSRKRSYRSTLTPEQVEVLRGFCKAGTSFYAMAKAMGVHRCVLARTARELKIKVRQTARMVAARKAVLALNAKRWEKAKRTRKLPQGRVPRPDAVPVARLDGPTYAAVEKLLRGVLTGDVTRHDFDAALDALCDRCTGLRAALEEAQGLAGAA